MKHCQFVVRNTGAICNELLIKLCITFLGVRAVIGMTGTRNIATYLLGARAVYGVIGS
jgi:hypothetical protein